MNILSIENLSKTLNDEPLFENATLGLEEGEKAGIVGRNGSGKSTFLKAIAGIIVPDDGKISMKNGTNLFYLPQDIAFRDGATITDFFYDSDNPVIRKLAEYRTSIEEGRSDSQRLFDEIEKDNLWEAERRFEGYLGKLGMAEPLTKRMSELSGGEQKKTAIARALSVSPDLLLLDEPTNHLDIPSIEFLENWISESSAAVIIVTHDRHILNQCCSSIWELDRKRFYRHPGSFSEYLERREERIRMNEKEQERLETILRRERKWLLRGPKARTGKDKNRKDRIEEMEDSLHSVRDPKQKEFTSGARRMGKKVLEAENIAKGYDGKMLFSSFTFSFQKGQRIGLIGSNGSGKSTLLDILTGRTEPDEGTIDKGVNTHFGYYDQMGRDLRSDKTIIEYAEDIGKTIRLSDKEEMSASSFLERFGFPPRMQRTPVGMLSGGERRRLYLITRLLSNPNFLILDEPTNDLDIETIENLEDYISSFSGTVMITSHDRTFLDIATEMLLVIKDGRITLFPGNYTEWKEREDEERKEEAPKEKPKAERREREKKGLTYREKKELEEIESKIAEAEELIAILEASFASAATDEYGTIAERTKLYNDKKAELEEMTERWMELEEKNEG